MTNVILHGALAEATGRRVWRLNIRQPREAIAAIDANCGGRLGRYLREHQREEFTVKVDDHYIQNPEKPTAERIVVPDELFIQGEFQTIEIAPVIAGQSAMDWVNGILGVILIIVGVVLILEGDVYSGTSLIILGVGMFAGAAISLLSKAPKLGTGKASRSFAPPAQTLAQKQEEDPRNNPNYLFSGGSNTTTEGGPVPIIYGDVITGSHLVSLALLPASLNDVRIGEAKPPKPNDEFFDLPVWERIDDHELGDLLISGRHVRNMKTAEKDAAWTEAGMPANYPAGSPIYGKRTPPPFREVRPGERRVILEHLAQFFNGPRKSLSKRELLEIYHLLELTDANPSKTASWKELAEAIALHYSPEP